MAPAATRSLPPVITGRGWRACATTGGRRGRTGEPVRPAHKLHDARIRADQLPGFVKLGLLSNSLRGTGQQVSPFTIPSSGL